MRTAATGKPRRTRAARTRSMRSNMKLINGRYQIPVLWKEFPPPLANNFESAKKRLLGLEKSKRFKTIDPSEYWDQKNEWEQRGFIEEVHTSTPDKDEAVYIPHFPVIRREKLSSQVRIVMDAAAKGATGKAINTYVHKAQS